MNATIHTVLTAVHTAITWKAINTVVSLRRQDEQPKHRLKISRELTPSSTILACSLAALLSNFY